jgi:large subunit ribosomal protein L4
MASLPILDRSGNEVGRYELELQDLAPRISKQLLHDVVVMYQANQRQGSFKTKGRGEVAGSTRKLYRQKGTGNARVGPRRTGKRVGGGHTFAKRPRDFSYRLPRKALQLATRMAIATKLKNEQMVIIDELKFDQPQTREMAAILRNLNLRGLTTLVAVADRDVNAWKSARNIEGVAIAPAAELNAYQVLKHHRLLLTKGALDRLREKQAASSSQATEA